MCCRRHGAGGMFLIRRDTIVKNAGAKVQTQAQRKRHALFRNREVLGAYAIVIPVTAYFVLRHYYPIFFAFFVSFSNYELLTGRFSYVGLDNYIEAFTDYRSIRSLINTSFFVLGQVTGVTLTGLLFALLLDRLGRATVVFRTIYFMPMVVSLVAISSLWMWIYHRDLGLLNWILGKVGISKIGWLVDPGYALLSVILMSVWRGMGFSMVIFLAGLTNIPEQFYDAAEVDGANRIQTTRMVTIPLLVPIILLVVVVNTMGAFKVFTQVYVMGQKGGTYFGGPMNSTLTIVLKVYESSFVDLRIGVGQALAFVLTAIVLTVTMVQRKLFSRFDFEY